MQISRWLRWKRDVIHTSCLGLEDHPHHGHSLKFTTHPHYGTNIVIFFRETGSTLKRVSDFLNTKPTALCTKLSVIEDKEFSSVSSTTPWINRDLAVAVAIEVGLDSFSDLQPYLEGLLQASMDPDTGLDGLIEADSSGTSETESNPHPDSTITHGQLSSYGYIHHLQRFMLENGAILRNVPVAYMYWGRLNKDKDNVIVICHAFSGSAMAHEWWPGMIGPGKCLDSDRFFIICLNFFGSPYGTASPITQNPYTEEQYRSSFPICSVRDTVRLHRAVLDDFGVQRLQLVLGGSIGGMQAIEWAFYGSDYVRAVCPIASGFKTSAWYMTFHDSMRNAIYADPKWRGGEYAAEDPPREGLSVARCIAFSTYISRPSFEDKCGRDITRNAQTPFEPSLFAMETYMHHQGVIFNDRFDAMCYIRITQMGDTHDVGRGRGGARHALASVTQPVLVVAINSDVLNPLEELQEFASLLPRGTLGIVQSVFGHDGFLLEVTQVTKLIKDWFENLNFGN
eukprot:TRINITY_DN8513_c0_g2_i2.p1 TRINITY_DN8513_c0_g2~~TRINITY_DN8513_c0_g2_i2.p1  ORF type:complete len:510 (+),score=79.79 TRINITY_DN8513_c0_g2_i2:213-1742(+)